MLPVQRDGMTRGLERSTVKKIIIKANKTERSTVLDTDGRSFDTHLENWGCFSGKQQ